MASNLKYTKDEWKSLTREANYYAERQACVPQTIEEALKPILEACSRRLNSWPAPPNWSPSAWREEANAIKAMAFVQAQAEYNVACGVVFGAFVYQKVMAQTRTRYRQEWAYAVRFAVELNQLGHDSNDRPEAFAAIRAAEWPCAADASLAHELRDCVECLREVDKWFLKQLFWHDRTQAEVARELGVTQQAVAKRLRAIRGVLREWLNPDSKNFWDRL
jgi:hypothetical protein